MISGSIQEKCNYYTVICIPELEIIENSLIQFGFPSGVIEDAVK
jgi:hypothetical protein